MKLADTLKHVLGKPSREGETQPENDSGAAPFLRTLEWGFFMLFVRLLSLLLIFVVAIVAFAQESKAPDTLSVPAEAKLYTLPNLLSRQPDGRPT